MNYAHFSGKIARSSEIIDGQTQRLSFFLEAINRENKASPLIVHCDCFIPEYVNRETNERLVVGTRVVVHGEIYLGSVAINGQNQSCFYLQVKSIDILSRANAEAGGNQPSQRANNSQPLSQQQLDEIRELHKQSYSMDSAQPASGFAHIEKDEHSINFQSSNPYVGGV